MKEPEAESIRELAARSRLEPADQRRLAAWLQQHPGDAESCERDRALSAALCRLPRPALASNFTTRVLETVRLEQPRRRPALPGAWHHCLQWLRHHPALASGFAVVAVAGVLSLGFLNVQTQRRLEMARSVAEVAAVAVLLSARESQVPTGALGQESLASSVALLRDFDAIARLRPGPAVDTELLAALR